MLLKELALLGSGGWKDERAEFISQGLRHEWMRVHDLQYVLTGNCGGR
jgi:hypothetical protein